MADSKSRNSEGPVRATPPDEAAEIMAFARDDSLPFRVRMLLARASGRLDADVELQASRNAAPQASPSVAPADSESGSAAGPAVAAPDAFTRSEKASLDEDAKLDAALHRNAADQLAQMVVDSLPSAGLRSAESYECQIKAQHQVIAERDATIASLRSHEQPIDIEERIRWHKSEARRLTLESIRGGQSSDIGEISDGNAR
jgi:hypothetical protein